MKNASSRLPTGRLITVGALALLAAAVWLEAWLRPQGLFVSFARATHALWDKPKIFGTYHLIALAICFAVALLALMLGGRLSPARLDGVVFAVGTVLFVLEIYKQLYYHTVLGNGHYNFAILPLQFCSWAMYLFLVIPLLPEGKVKDTLYTFCALYQVMGGCIVMVYPVLYAEISLSIHTMLWHTLMIATGFLIGRVRGYGRSYLGEMLPGTAVFGVTVVIATVLNVVLTPYTGNSVGALNLFYMSPYIPTHYVIIGDVWEAFGWFPALLCYVALFIFVGATLIWAVLWLARRIEGIPVKKKQRDP